MQQGAVDFLKIIPTLKLENVPTSVYKLKLAENSSLANLEIKTANYIPKQKRKRRPILKRKAKPNLKKQSKKNSNSKPKQNQL